MKRAVLILAALALLLIGGVEANAATIYVIDTGHTTDGLVNLPKTRLAALGYTVTSGNTLTDYSAFSQVWDLRYDMNLTADDVTAMGNYLQGGGRMYLTGENIQFDASRNNSLVSFLNSVGAGPVTLVGSTLDTGTSTQAITAEGQIVNSPHTLPRVAFGFARTASEASQGFLVTETSPGSGQGSVLGWDFGDIAGKPSARMLVAFDIGLFGPSGPNWTENMATFLGGDVAEVPEPATLTLLGIGIAGMAGYGWRKRKQAAV